MTFSLGGSEVRWGGVGRGLGGGGGGGRSSRCCRLVNASFVGWCKLALLTLSTCDKCIIEQLLSGVWSVMLECLQQVALLSSVARVQKVLMPQADSEQFSCYSASPKMHDSMDKSSMTFAILCNIQGY